MFHMCASVWMCGCPTCQCFRYGANSEEAGLCGGQWTTQEAEGAFVSSLLWSLPAVTALYCVLYEGPEKMGFPGLAQVRLGMCHRQWYYREPCRGKWQASNGGPCLMHSHYRQGQSLFFFSCNWFIIKRSNLLGEGIDTRIFHSSQRYKDLVTEVRSKGGCLTMAGGRTGLTLCLGLQKAFAWGALA